MSEKLDLLFSRRSIRAYTEEAVSKEDIEKIVKAGMAAPSAVNKRPWHITVIEDADLRQKIAATSGARRCCGMAPVVMLVSGDKRRFLDGQMAAVEAFWQQDCSAVTQNILLAATALNLGSLWMGVFPNTDTVRSMSEILELPEYLVPFALIAIGHKGEEKEARTQYEEEQVLWK